MTQTIRYAVMFLLAIVMVVVTTINAYTITTTTTKTMIQPTSYNKNTNHRLMVGSYTSSTTTTTLLRMSDDPNPPPFSSPTSSSTTSSSTTGSSNTNMIDPMSESLVDIETMKQLEKIRRAQELRDQEVFMKKSTGKHKCSNCDWEYDVLKGDSMMIGGQIKPNTLFNDLPSNWRCPVCRASKDSFIEMVEEIPGFEVNQKYGFGTNAWTAGQKNLAIFGGLGLFFILFLGGYALS